MNRSLSASRFSWLRSGLLAPGCLAMAVLVGCAYSDATRQLGPASAKTPRPGDRIAVMLAESPANAQPAVPDPGRILAKLTLDVIQQDFPSAGLLETTKEGEALARCRDQGVAYLVVPRIVRWGNHGTIEARFTGSVSVDLRLLLVVNKQLVKSLHYEGSNNSVTIGSDAPEALVDENYRDAVASLFRDR